MAVTTQDELMALGGWQVDVDYRASLLDELVDADRNPRPVHAFIYDADDELVYCGVLLRVGGGAEGLVIGGHGLLWHLGGGDVGTPITYREYVAGTNLLSNGDFSLEGGQYWRRRSEAGLWLAGEGSATNAGPTVGDDVLEYDLKLPTVPGRSYRQLALGTTGLGKLRVRTLYEGRFNPPNLLDDPGFDGDSWSTTASSSIVDGVLQCGPIPKPDLVIGFASGTDWSVAPEMAFVGGELVCSPIPWPVTDIPLTEDDWTNTSLYPEDMAFSGGVLLAGPVTRKQIIVNPSFTTDLSNWYMNGVDALGGTHDPHPGLFYWHATDGLDSGPGATTDGTANPFLRKYLRADPVSGGGVEEHAVTEGESYRGEAIIRFSPDVNPEAEAWIDLTIPHPTDLPQGMRWYGSRKVTASDEAERRIPVDVEVTLGPGRNELNALFEVHRHGAGFITVDEFFVYRIRGNYARVFRNTGLPIVERVDYRLSADVTSEEDQQVGNVALRCHLLGTGGTLDILEVREQTQDHTDLYTLRVDVDFTCPKDAVEMRPRIFARDIVGKPFRVENMRFYRTSQNSRRIHRSAFAVQPSQAYTLGADFIADAGVTKGTVTVGAVLFGPGQTPQIKTITWQAKADETEAERVEDTFTPPDGYTQCELYVDSLDLDGAPVRVRNLSLIKADNNSETVVGARFTATPERKYAWEETVWSDLQRGTVRLAARCIRDGYDDVTFESTARDNTKGERKRLRLEWTPPSGFDQVDPLIIFTDISGGICSVDDGDVRDTDSSTVVFDSVAIDPVDVNPFTDSIAPPGAETVRVQLVLESGATSYSVDGVSLARTGVAPATGNLIVADLLTNLNTGNPLSISPGVVTCPEVIPSDWEVVRMNNRSAWDAYCHVVSVPKREFRVNFGATVDVGASEDVFATTGVYLLPEDVDVVPVPSIQVDVVDRATEIEVIGAEVQTIGGHTVLISAVAAVPGPPRLGLNNHPIQRRRTVSDGTVNHHLYAQALADDLAAQEASPPLSITVEMSGPDRPGYGVGDWVHVYNPRGGIQDLDNPVEVRGAVVFPRRVRVFSRGRSLGPSHRIVIRREDGSTFDLEGVTWSDEEVTVLTVGDSRPRWQRNPQGLSAGEQYLRDRASKPR